MEKFVALAKKLKTLAEQGVGGEQTNASAKLAALMEKHGITMDMLDVNHISEHRFEITMDEKRLFVQIAHHVIGDGNGGVYDTRKNKKAIKHLLMIVECSQAQALEIWAKFEFYKMAYAKELDTFYKAFIHKNKLFGASVEDDDDREPTLEEKQEAYRIANMMQGMERHQFHKQIDNSKKS